MSEDIKLWLDERLGQETVEHIIESGYECIFRKSEFDYPFCIIVAERHDASKETDELCSKIICAPKICALGVESLTGVFSNLKEVGDYYVPKFFELENYRDDTSKEDMVRHLLASALDRSFFQPTFERNKKIFGFDIPHFINKHTSQVSMHKKMLSDLVNATFENISETMLLNYQRAFAKVSGEEVLPRLCAFCILYHSKYAQSYSKEHFDNILSELNKRVTIAPIIEYDPDEFEQRIQTLLHIYHGLTLAARDRTFAQQLIFTLQMFDSSLPTSEFGLLTTMGAFHSMGVQNRLPVSSVILKHPSFPMDAMKMINHGI